MQDGLKNRGEAIKRKGFAILMEGYLDVLTVKRYGFETAVASLGTAFTEEQASLLKRYTKNIIIAYDNDEAGKNAIIRAGYILKKFDYNVNVSNKKFYTPDETIKQKLGINVKFLKDRKNMLLTFKIDMIDNDDINILKLKVKYILTLNNEALDINESFIKKILSKFYPIFSKFILNFYNSIGLNNIQLPEF